VLFKGAGKYSRFFKNISPDSNPIYAVFLNEKEYGAPVFTSQQTAKEHVFSSHRLSIPIWNHEGKFQMVIQVSQDQLTAKLQAPKAANNAKSQLSHYPANDSKLES
jgi:hypothetical protein